MRNSLLRFPLLTVALLVLGGASISRAQGTDDVTKLKEKVELLEAKLEAANLKIEKLQAENERLKSAGTKKPADEEKESTKKSLSEILKEGSLISGNFQYKTLDQRSGKLSLAIKERDKSKFKGTLSVTLNLKNEEPAEFEVEGEIVGDKLMFHSVGSAIKGSFSVTRKGSGLEGTFSNSNNNYGTVGFKLP